MAKCYICNCDIDVKNTKPEHIIPNGIGGKLKSREILCSKHNNELFELDQIICKDLESHTNRLNPSRDNGKNPSISYELPSREKVIMQPGGEFYAVKPDIQVDKMDDGRIVIKYSTYYSTGSQHKEFALNQLKSVVRGICKKNGITDEFTKNMLNEVENTFEKSIKTDFNPILKGQFQFNSTGKLFLGLSKIALDYYFYNKLSKKHVEEFLDSFKEQDIDFINNNASYYYNDDLFLTDSIYHTLILKGDNANKLLYCIISLYGVLNCIIFLNRNYNGEDITKTYSYDLRNKEIVNFNITPKIDQNIAEELLKHRSILEELKKAQNVFMSFFKWGSEKDIQEDLKNFSNKIINAIKILQSQPIIDNFGKFKESFQEIYKKHAKESETLNKLTKHELNNLYEKFCSISIYEFYLQPYLLHIISKIIADALQKVLLTNPQILKNEKLLIDYIFNFYLSVKTNNETINKMLNDNKDKIQEHLSEYISTIYSQLIYFYGCLYKQIP